MVKLLISEIYMGLKSTLLMDAAFPVFAAIASCIHLPEDFWKVRFIFWKWRVLCPGTYILEV